MIHIAGWVHDRYGCGAHYTPALLVNGILVLLLLLYQATTSRGLGTVRQLREIVLAFIVTLPVVAISMIVVFAFGCL